MVENHACRVQRWLPLGVRERCIRNSGIPNEQRRRGFDTSDSLESGCADRDGNSVCLPGYFLHLHLLF